MIYFIQAINNPTGNVKIGHSEDPERRLTEFWGGSPDPLCIIKIIEGAQKDETALHHHFAHLRLHGEWFEYGKELKVFLGTGELPENKPKKKPKKRLSRTSRKKVTPIFRACWICDRPLKGKQRQFCGDRCRKRFSRQSKLITSTPPEPLYANEDFWPIHGHLIRVEYL